MMFLLVGFWFESMIFMRECLIRLNVLFVWESLRLGRCFEFCLSVIIFFIFFVLICGLWSFLYVFCVELILFWKLCCFIFLCWWRGRCLNMFVVLLCCFFWCWILILDYFLLIMRLKFCMIMCCSYWKVGSFLVFLDWCCCFLVVVYLCLVRKIFLLVF